MLLRAGLGARGPVPGGRGDWAQGSDDVETGEESHTVVAPSPRAGPVAGDNSELDHRPAETSHEPHM